MSAPHTGQSRDESASRQGNGGDFGAVKPNTPPFRPAPARSATLGNMPQGYKSRATSQPPGERMPLGGGSPFNGTLPESGRGSPSGQFGVIGGSRTPSKFAVPGSGTATRANSFSAGELRESRNPSKIRTLSSHVEEVPSRSHSTSPFPTFSPSSSPSNSPSSYLPNLPSRSPPKAGANSSRSRSQSLATGVRPMYDRSFPVTMSTLENTGSLSRFQDPGWSDPVEGSNMSPFTRNVSTLGGYGTSAGADRFKSPVEGLFPQRMYATGGWGSSAPEKTLSPSALSTSVAKALGGFGQSQNTIVGGFGDNSNGNKSGSSSRRHSVSVVGGPGGRRDMFSDGFGMTSPPGRGLGQLGFTDAELLPEKLGNALNLEIDESRKRGVEIEMGKGVPITRRELPRSSHHSGSLPKFDQLGNGILKPSSFSSGIFGSPSRGRAENLLSTSNEREASENSKSSRGSRFNFDQPASRTNGPIGVMPPGVDRGREIEGPGPIGLGGPRLGNPNVGAIGIPPSQFDSRLGYQSQSYTRPNNYLPMGPSSPIQQMGPGFGRQPQMYGTNGMAPGQQGMGVRPPQGTLQSGPFSPIGQATYGLPSMGPGQMMGGQGYPYYPPTINNSPPQPTSPSFSSLSLSDLGRGIPLGAMPVTTPLYIVTFKAGRRDVFYCPDPTLLISNGDKVIVEADRGSDLGTVIFDQLTPVEVREWQEKQATATLMSGAREHQPPGLAMNPKMPHYGSHLQRNIGIGGIGGIDPSLATADLATLLAGVGNGSMDTNLGSGGVSINGGGMVGNGNNRGPLVKEIMPKRIFAKSSQGPEDQARMMDKLRDEHDALMICREKAAQRGMPMQIVDAEYQWDRRKLTFYFKADKRIDFRDLTKENFRIFKSRIWMAMVPKDDPRQ